jgi:hypothetical protein
VATHSVSAIFMASNRLRRESGVRGEVATAASTSAVGVESHRPVQHHRHPYEHGRNDCFRMPHKDELGTKDRRGRRQ